MIIDEDVYLAHYGKKGMKWGVRNNATASEKAAKKLDRLSGQKIYDGNGYKGYYGQRVAKQRERKAPGSSLTKNMTPEELARVKRQINRKTYTGIVLRGATAVTVSLAAPKLASSLNVNPKDVAIISKGSKFVAAGQALTTVQQVRAVQTANKADKLREQIRDQ